MKRFLPAAIALVLCAAGPVDPARVEAVVAATFAHAPEAWRARVTQDETQGLCSDRRNDPSAAEAAAIQTREEASIVLPASGGVMGDWTRGAAIAESGVGGQFTDAPGTVSGGNCYACHQIDPAEIAHGTLGPSLAGYGRARDFSPDAAREAYRRIYNPQALHACSTMPRFGRNKILTEQQIKDLVAYLMARESPVNAP